MRRTSAFTGKLVKPHLTVHTTGDALIPVQAESAYARAATAGGSAPQLRQAYVDNAGHCNFSTGEQVAALDALEERITTGRWLGTDPEALNARGAAAQFPRSRARARTSRARSTDMPVVASARSSLPGGAE